MCVPSSRSRIRSRDRGRAPATRPDDRTRRRNTGYHVRVRRLVLFDIDGTLLTTGGVSGAALVRALEEVFGRPVPADGYPFMGKTDPRIVRELATLAGVPEREVEAGLATALERYLDLLDAWLEPRHVEIKPGVEALLDALEARPGVMVGLLTGNMERGARIKLERAGLGHRFALGAFGSDREDRDELVPVALRRAAAIAGQRLPPARVTVVGDAPPDVACARAAGARSVAVATGWTPAEELARLAPDVLLPSLADTETAVAALDPD